jgi:hypothetical protein
LTHYIQGDGDERLIHDVEDYIDALLKVLPDGSRRCFVTYLADKYFDLND